MPGKIHPTAIVESGAKLGEDVDVGAYAFIGATAVIGARSQIHHHATVEGHTTMGVECQVFPYACIGGKTQDLKFKGGKPGVRIGDRNVFREYVSVHEATNDGEFTVIGSDNLILAYSHVAHDCVLGSKIIMSNYAGLAGHVVVEDSVVVGAFGGVHQFCRIGAHAMLSACSKLVQDIPPYFIADGSPATVRAYNKVGLERSGHSAEQIDRVRQLYRLLYRDGLNRSQALEKLEAHEHASSAEFQRMITFAKASQRGLAPSS
jgi:UDP-N-acetylglucosamine acyltransferase